jgi:hypothetical protein
MAGFAYIQSVRVFLVIGDANQVRRLAFVNHFDDGAAGKNGEIVRVRGDNDQRPTVIGLGRPRRQRRWQQQAHWKGLPGVKWFS